MQEWEAQALSETWREAAHEAELAATGTIIADHRTGYKAYNLDAVLDGALGPVIESAIELDEQHRLQQIGQGAGAQDLG